MDAGSGLTAAVIIGAIVSIVTLIVGRGSKISEFRQAWINDQRADLATFGAAALSLARQKSSDRAAEYDKLEQAALRIRLRENPIKPEWTAVISSMDQVRTDLLAHDAASRDIFADVARITDAASLVLKGEWRKVRSGEIGYRIVCGIFALLCAGLLWMAYDGLAPGGGPAKAVTAPPVERKLGGASQPIAPPAQPSPATLTPPPGPRVAPTAGATQ